MPGGRLKQTQRERLETSESNEKSILEKKEGRKEGSKQASKQARREGEGREDYRKEVHFDEKK